MIPFITRIMGQLTLATDFQCHRGSGVASTETATVRWQVKMKLDRVSVSDGFPLFATPCYRKLTLSSLVRYTNVIFIRTVMKIVRPMAGKQARACLSFPMHIGFVSAKKISTSFINKQVIAQAKCQVTEKGNKFSYSYNLMRTIQRVINEIYS